MYNVTSSVDSDQVEQVEHESREKLRGLSERYDLSPKQQHKIFPIVVAHHELAHEGMSVSGKLLVLPTSNNGNLLDAIYGELNDVQRIKMEDDLVGQQRWWTEVIATMEQGMARNDIATAALLAREAE